MTIVTAEQGMNLELLFTLTLPWLPRRHSKLLNIDDDDDEHMNYRQQKSLGFRVRLHYQQKMSIADSLQNPKSHRLIEKRRRDRLNRSLAELLDLIPHKKPEVNLQRSVNGMKKNGFSFVALSL